MTTLFISDLHLDGARPDITAQFLDFLDREARRAQALYILGDLFEAWIGDDDPDPDKRRVIQRPALASRRRREDVPDPRQPRLPHRQALLPRNRRASC